MTHMTRSKALLHLSLVLMLALVTGCSSSIYGWQVRTRSSPFAPSFDPVFQLAALQGGSDSGLEFALKGLTGGLTTVFMRTSLATVIKEYVEKDQRTVRRYQLNLTAFEKRRLLERDP